MVAHLMHRQKPLKILWMCKLGFFTQIIRVPHGSLFDA